MKHSRRRVDPAVLCALLIKGLDLSASTQAKPEGEMRRALDALNLRARPLRGGHRPSAAQDVVSPRERLFLYVAVEARPPMRKQLG